MKPVPGLAFSASSTLASSSYRSQHAHRQGRSRFNFLPLPECFNRLVHVAGLERQLRGTPCQARIAGFSGDVHAAFHGKCFLPALVGYLGQQEFIE
jgi:hypothetical protein